MLLSERNRRARTKVPNRDGTIAAISGRIMKIETDDHLSRSITARDSLRRYLIDRAEVLRAARSTPERDNELAKLEGYIRWLRGAI